MSDQQCGLCLSCGAPFLPEIDQVDFFNREGNLSVLFLNTQFKQNPDIQRMYDFPKLCSQRQASHMIHEAYHQTALDYMCNRHTNDSDVGINPLAPAVVLPAAFQIPRVANAPFLYYHVASTRAGPQAATWVRPTAINRINFADLMTWLARASRTVTARPVAQSLKQVYDICQGCNALMTQKSHFRFILGLRGAGGKNSRGIVLPGPVLQQYNVTPHGAPLERGYGRWRIANNPNMTHSPLLAKSDSEAPCIAYYLHMCLPFQAAQNNDPFAAVSQPLRNSGRALYLQLCWIMLEIACLATLLQEGTVTKGRNVKKSHGMHQHRGVLDLYVSYFFWKMIQFEFGLLVNRVGMNFVQWHQKYYCDAKNCPGLLDRPAAAGIIGRLMFAHSDVGGRALLRQICRRLVDFYQVELAPLVVHVCGQVYPAPPGPTVHQYFLPVRVAAVLGDRSLEVCLCCFIYCFPFVCSNQQSRRPP